MFRRGEEYRSRKFSRAGRLKNKPACSRSSPIRTCQIPKSAHEFIKGRLLLIHSQVSDTPLLRMSERKRSRLQLPPRSFSAQSVNGIRHKSIENSTQLKKFCFTGIWSLDEGSVSRKKASVSSNFTYQLNSKMLTSSTVEFKDGSGMSSSKGQGLTWFLFHLEKETVDHLPRQLSLWLKVSRSRPLTCQACLEALLRHLQWRKSPDLC